MGYGLGMKARTEPEGITRPDFPGRRRVLRLAAGQSPDTLAAAARDLLRLDGVSAAAVVGARCLAVDYDLRRACLERITGALAAGGYVLDNGPIPRLCRALAHYADHTALANAGREQDLPTATRDAFVGAWRRRSHGCRDLRPSHWRRYL